MRLDSYSRALMGFDFADASALLTARRKFADYLAENGVDQNQAESDTHEMNHSWEFAVHNLGKPFMLRHMPPWRGLMDLKSGNPHLKIFGKYVELRERVYHLPGQHDQCDHSVTGGCIAKEAPDLKKSGLFDSAIKWKKGLSWNTTVTLEQYSLGGGTGSSIKVNAFLRKVGEPGGGDVKKRVMALDEAIAAYKLPKEIVVYRGASLPSKIAGTLAKGKTFADAAYVSTSQSRSLIDKFMNECPTCGKSGYEKIMLRIKLPKGSAAAPMQIAAATEWRKEREMLLPRKSRFKIIDIKQDKGFKIIDAVVV